MYNAFLVIRTVFFALLVYFHALVLVFASWNIAAATSSGSSAPGATVFLLIDSVLIFVLVSVAYLAEIVCAKARPAQVRLECAWTALMCILQLAASIDVTMNGPPMHCQTSSPWAMCASSSLLVHISWLVTLIIFSYCLTISVTAAAHSATLPDIWITPVPHVPWFSPAAETPAPVVISHLPIHKHSKAPLASTSSEETCAISKYISERWEKLSRNERHTRASGPILFGPGRQSADPARPTWARQLRIRRGVDDPFSKPLPKEPSVLMQPPPRTYSRQGAALKDARSVVCNRQETKTNSSSTLVSQTSFAFPREIADPDLPIPRPSISQWVRANNLSWISIESERAIWS